MILELTRLGTTDYGTFGALMVDHLPFCVTLEPRWIDNSPFLSCIPPGIYLCEITQLPKFGETFEILNVENRTNVLLHAGNVEADTEGCIILASSFGKLGENYAVLNSGNTFKRFMQLAHRQTHLALSIAWSPHVPLYKYDD